MKIPTQLVMGVIFLVAGMASESRGAVLVTYDFTGSNGLQSSVAADTVTSNLSASSISRGTNYGAPASSSGFTADGMAFSPGLATANTDFLSNYTISTAVANDAYFELTLSISGGYELTLDSIVLGTRRASSTSGPNNFGVRSSLDGYTTDLLTGISAAGAGGNVSNDRTLSFGSSLQDLTGSLTLRFYGYGRGTSASYGLWVISNPSSGDFTINGTLSAVPEPSAMLLLSAGLGALVLLNRKKRRLVHTA